ncbi:pentapeptide repeat-containing protein [Streptomyces siamensis]|uniref:Pentapeptide repeat-containing protein n=1 Tax=Streptomyces siamensis TaxID=1274986 RepID=A0ABP9JE46_9ACTN
MSDEQPAKKPRPWWHWALAAAGTSAFVIALVWGPWWIEGHHLRDDKGQLVSSAGIIVTGFRTMVIAIAAGVLTAAGLYYTRQKHQLEREQFQHAQEQFAENQKQFETTVRDAQARDERQTELTREGQVTGRYVEAIKLLSSDNITQRLGGIYSLERIMRDSEKDHDTIVEVLAAFIRHRAPVQAGNHTAQSSESGQPPKPADDVQAALTVLYRRPTRPELPSIDLSHTCLAGAKLTGHGLRRAHWSGAQFEGSDLTQARLRGAILRKAQFKDATLHGTDLSSAKMADAELCGADLRGADFGGVDLTGVDLTGAKLIGAQLGETHEIHVWRLLQARLHSSTELPADIAQDPAVIAHIAKCEEGWPLRPSLPTQPAPTTNATAQ